MSSSTPLLVLFSILSGIWWYMSISNKYRRFPGPKPHLFVGHTLQVPTIKTWKYFEKLWHEYGACPRPSIYCCIYIWFAGCEGSIVGLSLAGDEIIVLSDAADAEELVRKLSRYQVSCHNVFPSSVAVHTITLPEDLWFMPENIYPTINEYSFFPMETIWRDSALLSTKCFNPEVRSYRSM